MSFDRYGPDIAQLPNTQSLYNFKCLQLLGSVASDAPGAPFDVEGESSECTVESVEFLVYNQPKFQGDIQQQLYLKEKFIWYSSLSPSPSFYCHVTDWIRCSFICLLQVLTGPSCLCNE